MIKNFIRKLVTAVMIYIGLMVGEAYIITEMYDLPLAEELLMLFAGHILAIFIALIFVVKSND